MKQILRTPPAGFTLTELAIVLVIVALLIGGMMVPLSTQRDLQKSRETGHRLSEIKEALLGFAAIYVRLPCPTTETDPASNKYGLEDATCVEVEGYLPWRSLGIRETDAWGSVRSSTTDPFVGYWRYRVDKNFVTSISITTATGSALVVQDNNGNALTATAHSPVAIVYSAGPDLVANGKNEDTQSGPQTDPIYQSSDRSPTFDDQLIWIGRPLLFNRLISAGKLP